MQTWILLKVPVIGAFTLVVLYLVGVPGDVAFICGAVLFVLGRHPVPTHLPRQGFFYFPHYIDIV